MKSATTITAALLALSLLCLPLDAGAGRGGGGDGGGGGPGGSGMGGSEMGGPGGGYGGGQREMMERGQKERSRSLAREQQRERLRTCEDSVKRLHARTREMRQFASRDRFTVAKARNVHSRLREEMKTMERDHERLVNSIGENPSAGVRSRVQSMNEARDQVRSRLQEMDGELSKDAPSRERLEMQAREMERATNEWSQQYREMAKEMEKK